MYYYSLHREFCPSHTHAHLAPSLIRALALFPLLGTLLAEISMACSSASLESLLQCYSLSTACPNYPLKFAISSGSSTS